MCYPQKFNIFNLRIFTYVKMVYYLDEKLILYKGLNIVANYVEYQRIEEKKKNLNIWIRLNAHIFIAQLNSSISNENIKSVSIIINMKHQYNCLLQQKVNQT